MAATLREHRGAVEADFHNYYDVEDFDETFAEKGMRWVYVRVKYLPPGAALWRVQPSDEEPSEIEPVRVDTSDSDAIEAAFRQLAG